MMCGNKLLFSKIRCDVITFCQTFHWLNPSFATLGIQTILKPGGFLFFTETKAVLPRTHPFQKLFGYGYSHHDALWKECNDHQGRYIQLFNALKRPGAALVPRGAWLFREPKLFDMDFGRAFFFTSQVSASMPDEKDPWKRLARLMRTRRTKDLSGHMYWLVLKFEKCSYDDPWPKDIGVPRHAIEIEAHT
jgi:hypothetical protein